LAGNRTKSGGSRGNAMHDGDDDDEDAAYRRAYGSNTHQQRQGSNSNGNQNDRNPFMTDFDDDEHELLSSSPSSSLSARRGAGHNTQQQQQLQQQQQQFSNQHANDESSSSRRSTHRQGGRVDESDHDFVHFSHDRHQQQQQHLQASPLQFERKHGQQHRRQHDTSFDSPALSSQSRRAQQQSQSRKFTPASAASASNDHDWVDRLPPTTSLGKSFSLDSPAPQHQQQQQQHQQQQQQPVSSFADGIGADRWLRSTPSSKSRAAKIATYSGSKARRY
jgi:hypothetical protein